MLEISLHDDLLELTLDNPPVNALGAPLRQQIERAVADAQSNDAVRAIVIRGAGKLFSGGADITEFGQPPIHPWLPALVDQIEASAKPIVAAIHGTCFGGGLEIALACHYRIAAPSAKFALPEVKLGLLPGAGGTQRLPRLVGAEVALDVIVGGNPVTAEIAYKTGLIDRLAEEQQLAAKAIAFAQEVAAIGPRRTGERAVETTNRLFEDFATANARRIKGQDAPAACIEAVEAATRLPLAEGLAWERAAFLRLLEGTQSKALRHIFFAERSAAKISDLSKETPSRPITHVGIIGAGTMGAGIAMNFLSAGMRVTMVETAHEALDRGIATIRTNYETSAAKGRMTTDQIKRAMELLTPTLNFEALARCDLVIEAVYENMEVKQEIFRRLDAVAPPGAILASNTSYLDIDAIAAVTQRPQDVLGLHFFSPANVMKLVEVVRGRATSLDALATAMDLAKRIRKIAVVTGVCYGFIGNRMLIPRQRQAEALLLEGATPEQIDRVHTDFGMPMGPFQMADLAGVDIGWHRDPSRIETIRDALCAEGRWGQKRRAGFYDYNDKRRPTPSAATAGIIDRFRSQAGIVPRAISKEEIVARTLYTMINEGARILDDGIAKRASDIDVVWVYGYGWPATTGGPMFWAETVGFDVIAKGLTTYRDRLGKGFALSPWFSHR